MLRSCLFLSCCVVVLVASGAGRADEQVEYLSKQIQGSTDERVKIQAALILGSSDNPNAVEPLCKGLADANELFRIAVVKALYQLGADAAFACLRKHKDTSPAVLAEIKRALVPPKAYVSLEISFAKAESLKPQQREMLRREIRMLLRAQGALVAPRDEKPGAVNAVLQKYKIKGYALRIETEMKPDGSLGLDVLCLTYPRERLRGQVTLSAKGADPEDLIAALVPRLVDQAGKTLEWGL